MTDSDVPVRPRLGLLTHAPTGGSYRKAISDTVDLCVEAERLGYHSVWLAQHHFGAEDGTVPSPLVVLAAVAMRTERIRLGTAVITLALEDPIRTAEDAALVDLLSDERVELGIGSGAHPPTFLAMRRDYARRSVDRDVNLAVLTSALIGDALPGGSVLRPTAPTLTERLWRATSTRKGAAEAARGGHGILLARSWPMEAGPIGVHQLPIASEYRQVGRVDGRPPRIGVTRTVIPDPHGDLLARTAEAARRWAATEGLPPELNATGDDDVTTRHGIIVGDRSRIIDAIDADPTIALATDLLVQFQPGDLTRAESFAALRTIIDAYQSTAVPR